MTDKPKPPENVRIVRSDGTELACELVYAGEEEDEKGKLAHVWEIAGAVFMPGDKLAIDVLYAYTGLRFAADEKVKNLSDHGHPDLHVERGK